MSAILRSSSVFSVFRSTTVRPWSSSTLKVCTGAGTVGRSQRQTRQPNCVGRNNLTFQTRPKSTKVKQQPFLRRFSGAAASASSSSTTNLRPELEEQASSEIPNEGESERVAARWSGGLMDQELLRLDLEARRNGRLTKKGVLHVLDMMKNLGSASGVQSLLLIRCCGALMPSERRKDRTRLANAVWEMLKSIDCPLDVSHYNALLKVHLENEAPFEAAHFLAQMEKEGVTPNRVTYQRLIARYCQLGDIQGASQILEFMKSQDLAINEFVFNELIFGHAKNNDLSGAREILNVMRGVKLDPSKESFKALAKGQAWLGQGVAETLKEAEAQEQPLSDKDKLELMLILARKGNLEEAAQLLDSMQKGLGYNQECINAILELISCEGQGEEEEVDVGRDASTTTPPGGELEDLAYRVLLTMPRVGRSDGTLNPAGNFFLNQLIEAEKPVDRIVAFLNRLKADNLNESPLLHATHMALFSQKPKHALAFIQQLAQQGYPVRNHYFWPILRQTAEPEGVYSILGSMTKLGCLPNYDTLEEYVLPSLDASKPKDIVGRMKATGLTAGASVNPIAYYLLNRGLTQQAAQLLEEFPIRLNPRIASRTLANAFAKSGDVVNTAQILKHVRDNPEIVADQVLRNDVCGQFLLECLPQCHEIRQLQPLMKEMLAQGLLISRQAVDMVHLRAPQFNVETNQLLEELSSLDLEAPLPTDPHTHFPHPREMNAEDLERHLLELRAKGMNARGVLRRLLLLHCRAKNLDRVEEIRAELDQEGMLYSSAMLAQLIHLYTHFHKLDEATRLYQQLQETEPGFNIDVYKLINLATLMVKEGHDKEALELMCNVRFDPARDETALLSRTALERNVFRLLSSAAEKGDVPLTRKLFEETVVKGELTKPSGLILGQIIKAHLNNGDLASAMAEFVNCVNNYRLTPLKNELLRRLIEVEDADNLQKMLDLSNPIHGEVNILYDLSIAFIEMGRPKQAKKVMQTPGLRANMSRLDLVSEHLISKDKIDELEQFVEVTKNLFDIDRDRMYFHLLSAYDKSGQVDKALSLWTVFQEEDVQPSPETLRYLASLLIKHKREVPFDVPDIPPPSSTTTPTSRWYNQTNGGFPSSRGEPLSSRTPRSSSSFGAGPPIIESRTNIITDLVQQKKLKEAGFELHDMLRRGHYPAIPVFRFILAQLANGGQAETLSSLEPLVSPKLKPKINFSSHLLIAQIKNGEEGHQILSQLESEASFSDLTNFPLAGLLELLRAHPQMEKQVVSLSDLYVSRVNFWLPKNILWIHFMIHSKFVEAEQLLQSFPESVVSQKFLFGRVRKEAIEQESMELAERLISSVESLPSLSDAERGLAYSCLIDVRLSRKETDAALAALQTLCRSGKTEIGHLRRETLSDLKKRLEEEGKPVPFDAPPTLNNRSGEPRRRRPTALESGTTPTKPVAEGDDSSSSDDERTRRR